MSPARNRISYFETTHLVRLSFLFAPPFKPCCPSAQRAPTTVTRAAPPLLPPCRAPPQTPRNLAVSVARGVQHTTFPIPLLPPGVPRYQSTAAPLPAAPPPPVCRGDRAPCEGYMLTPSRERGPGPGPLSRTAISPRLGQCWPLSYRVTGAAKIGRSRN